MTSTLFSSAPYPPIAIILPVGTRAPIALRCGAGSAYRRPTHRRDARRSAMATSYVSEPRPQPPPSVFAYPPGYSLSPFHPPSLPFS